MTWSKNFTKHKKPFWVLYWMSIFLQEEVTLVGRICCDSLGKMNAKSVILEGSRDTSAGRSVPLDLSDLKQYSLFPGQVRIYTVHHIYCNYEMFESWGGGVCVFNSCFIPLLLNQLFVYHWSLYHMLLCMKSYFLGNIWMKLNISVFSQIYMYMISHESIFF